MLRVLIKKKKKKKLPKKKEEKKEKKALIMVELKFPNKSIMVAFIEGGTRQNRVGRHHNWI